jgi:hypothetical protein
MMANLRKAAEMALEALESPGFAKPKGVTDAIKTLRQALAQPEQEPTSVKHMVSWIDYLKGFSDNGIHMKIQSGLSAGDCYRLAVELEQFINRTHVDAVNISQERVDETAKREHEPVAWRKVDGDGYGYCDDMTDFPTHEDYGWQPLYTSPPKREWVGLTKEEMLDCWRQAHEPGNREYVNAVNMARAVLDKAKEKNT